MQNKKEMLLKRLTELVPNQENDFLKFIVNLGNPFLKTSDLSQDELLELFITFEEEENEFILDNKFELNNEILNEMLSIYVPAFKSGFTFNLIKNHE